jgi:hypothetical protein
VEKVKRQDILPEIATIYHGFTDYSADRHGNEVLVGPNFLGFWGQGGFVNLQDVRKMSLQPTELLLLWARISWV